MLANVFEVQYSALLTRATGKNGDSKPNYVVNIFFCFCFVCSSIESDSHTNLSSCLNMVKVNCPMKFGIECHLKKKDEQKQWKTEYCLFEIESFSHFICKIFKCEMKRFHKHCEKVLFLCVAVKMVIIVDWTYACRHKCK